MKHHLLLVIVFCIGTPILAQAGKLDKSVFRLKLAGVSGIYVSDWEKRNQDFSFVYGKSIEENWKDQNKATGYRIGADYYASLKDPIFTHLLFGVSLSNLKGSFPTNRYKDTQIESLNYKGNLQQIELTFGAVISIFEPFRIIPKFVYRSFDQTLNSNKTVFISDATDFGLIRGKENIRGKDASGYLGFGLEYDLTPNLTIYFDTLLFNNVIFLSSGKYTVSSSAEGYLLSNGSVGISNRIDGSTGSYKMHGNRFLLGGSLKVSESVRLFLSAERDTIYTEIGSAFGTNVVATAILTSRSFIATTDTLNKTIAENLVYPSRQKMENTTVMFGISKDLDL
jgi:hypothetical protein